MSYIERQFNKLSGMDLRMKVTSSRGETHWLDVTQEEAHAIELILQKREIAETQALIEDLGL